MKSIDIISLTQVVFEEDFNVVMSLLPAGDAAYSGQTFDSVS